jgi:probable rRNA maturation factor
VRVSVDLQIACPVDSIPPETEVREWLEQTFQAGRPDAAGTSEVSVRIVDEIESRELNKQYRQQDKSTNVLAFPASVIGLPKDAGELLGDLVICAPLVEQEAREQGKSASGHWGHLLVHGMLHLLGYDHETSSQAAEMESMEKRILADRGVDDPYRVG